VISRPFSMRAIVKIPFRGAPDGEPYPKQFQPGDLVEGELGAVAVAEGWAAPESSAPRAPLAPSNTQALGGAPEPFREAVSTPVRRDRKRAKPDG
jgi:hypothetical protein